MVSYTVPGVYVEEPTGLSLSVQTGETAVPVFAYVNDSDPDLKKIFKENDVTAFSSWLDVVSEISKLNLTEDVQKSLTNTLETHRLYQSLKLYFINGGGRCYIAPLEKFEKLVPALDDATLLVQAGSGLRDFKAAVEKLCGKGKTLFALFDGPDASLPDKDAVVREQQQYPSTPYAAAYWPWLVADAGSHHYPPSGAVAGVYARVDRERGVWKAPANVPITGAVPAVMVSDEIDGYCNAPQTNGQSFNVIREFRGTGPLIWGARTLNSLDNNWKYVPVRRLFSAVEKDIKTAMTVAIFEPNSQPTWAQVRGAAESYLHSLWKQGALLGDTPEQAYQVQIGLGITMTQQDINDGIMKLKVALAAVRPAEFIVLEVSQLMIAG